KLENAMKSVTVTTTTPINNIEKELEHLRTAEYWECTEDAAVMTIYRTGYNSQTLNAQIVTLSEQLCKLPKSNLSLAQKELSDVVQTLENMQRSRPICSLPSLEEKKSQIEDE